jgi:hypothetical protein
VSREELAKRLWAEHQAAAFPEVLYEEIEGVDIPMVDADVAGCVSRWIDSPNPFQLGEPQRAWLARSVEDLDRVLPRVRDPAAAAYLERLRRLAHLALASSE